MNRSIYTKLAISNLKNNRKTYIPYVLTAILTVMMYYMMANLAANSPMNQEALQIISCNRNICTDLSVLHQQFSDQKKEKRNRSVSYSRNGETAACENAGDRDGCNRCGQYPGWNLFRNCACKADVCTFEKNDSL